MENITGNLGQYFVPVKALVVYKAMNPDTGTYVEAYDIGKQGKPVNGHPLSIRECSELADALNTTDGVNTAFLKPKGLMPSNVCYINPERNGYAVWHTPGTEQTLFFTDTLGIPSGKCSLPPLVWKANRGILSVFAWDGDGNIHEDTTLYTAPFFNIYSDGNVCMGKVKIDITPFMGLENFMDAWMSYFFNSYFSHLLGGSPAKVNIVQLWKNLSGSGKPFPMEVLKETNFKLKDIIG